MNVTKNLRRVLIKSALIVAFPIVLQAQAPVPAGGGSNGPSGAAMGRTSGITEEAMTGQVVTTNKETTIVNPSETPTPHRQAAKKAKKKSNN